jgi:hypothetical protein
VVQFAPLGVFPLFADLAGTLQLRRSEDLPIGNPWLSVDLSEFSFHACAGAMLPSPCSSECAALRFLAAKRFNSTSFPLSFNDDKKEGGCATFRKPSLSDASYRKIENRRASSNSCFPGW